MASFARIAPLFVAVAAIAIAIPTTVLAEPTSPTTTTTAPLTTTTVPLTTTTAPLTTTTAPLTTTTAPLTTTTESVTTSMAPKAANVLLEITGTGTVYSIDIDPGGRVATENSAVPFRTSITATPGTLVQIVAVTKTGDQGCRITVNDTVVVSQGAGNAHCVYSLP